MGEYFIAVNVTREQYIHPHDVGCGLKLGEWFDHQDSTVWKQARARWSPDDEVLAISDYGSVFVMWLPPDKSLSPTRPGYDRVRETFDRVSLQKSLSDDDL